MSLHSKLKATWNACEFGVKQRVFNDDIPQTTIQYILKTPKYQDQDKMQVDKEALATRRDIANTELEIARENKNQYDLKAKKDK